MPWVLIKALLLKLIELICFLSQIMNWLKSPGGLLALEHYHLGLVLWQLPHVLILCTIALLFSAVFQCAILLPAYWLLNNFQPENNSVRKFGELVLAQVRHILIPGIGIDPIPVLFQPYISACNSCQYQSLLVQAKTKGTYVECSLAKDGGAELWHYGESSPHVLFIVFIVQK